MGYIQTKQQLLDDPTISFWLKRNIQILDDRDVLDAHNDVAILQELFQTKVDEVLGIDRTKFFQSLSTT